MSWSSFGLSLGRCLMPRAGAAPQPGPLSGWGGGTALGSPWCPSPEAAASSHHAPKSYFLGKWQKCLIEHLSTLIAEVFVGSKSQPPSSCAGEFTVSFILMCAWWIMSSKTGKKKLHRIQGNYIVQIHCICLYMCVWRYNSLREAYQAPPGDDSYLGLRLL